MEIDCGTQPMMDFGGFMGSSPLPPKMELPPAGFLSPDPVTSFPSPNPPMPSVPEGAGLPHRSSSGGGVSNHHSHQPSAPPPPAHLKPHAAVSSPMAVGARRVAVAWSGGSGVGGGVRLVKVVAAPPAVAPPALRAAVPNATAPQRAPVVMAVTTAQVRCTNCGTSNSFAAGLKAFTCYKCHCVFRAGSPPSAPAAPKPSSASWPQALARPRTGK
eukprot:RCo017297